MTASATGGLEVRGLKVVFETDDGLVEAVRGIDFDVRFHRSSGWYTSLRVAESWTAYKVLVEKGTGRILGAHVLGPGAEEQINLFTMAMGAGLTANQVKGVVFAYPSYASDLASMVEPLTRCSGTGFRLE